jgi:putative DNA primase/helicase
VALPLWIVFSHGIDSVQTAPILAVTSPEKRCGKTTLMDLLGRLTRRPLTSSNISPSAIFRSIEKWQPTLLIDEADTFLHESDEMRGILNSGHTRASAYVVRNVGTDFEPQPFSTWSAKAIALIGKLPATLHDRSIAVEMRRKLKHEKVEKVRHVDPVIFEALYRRCRRFAADQAKALKRCRPDPPNELHDRAADNWEPLLAIAELAGGEWPTKARDAAKALTGLVGHSDSVQVDLLHDLREQFDAAGVSRISSEDLVKALCADEARPWATYNKGERITQRQVAALLRNFDILSGTIRLPDGKTLRGYVREKCEDAFARYLPAADVQQRHNPHAASSVAGLAASTGSGTLRFANPPQPASSLACSGVADENVQIGEEEAEERS